MQSVNGLVRGLVAGACITLILPVGLQACITFERVYSTSHSDNGGAVRQTSDGGYIVGGDADCDFYLIKTDSLGDTLWSGAWGGSNDEWLRNLERTQDGGYILVGYTLSFGPGGAALYVVRTDSVGALLWGRTYGGSGWDEGYDVETAPDGGFAIAGYTGSFGAGVTDAYLVRTDSVGDTAWTRTYGGSSSDWACSIDRTTDGGYILAGGTMSFGAGSWDFYLVKTDTLGQWLWEWAYGGGGEDIAMSVEQTSDGGYILLGYTFSFGAGDADFYLVKTDSLGDTLWTATYGGSGREIGYSVCETQDGGYIITGETSSFGAGYYDLYLVKTDSLGNMLWDTTYGNSDYDSGRDVHQTSDGGYIVVGTLGRSSSPWSDVYLLKLSPHGTLDWHDVAVVGIGAPPDTVYTGSSQNVVVTVRNLGNLAESFDVTATIDGYEDTVQVTGLAPGFATQRTFSEWLVPPADSTTYTMAVCARLVGDFDTVNDCVQKTIFAYNPTGIEEERSMFKVERSMIVLQNEPNPFRGTTVISYSLPAATHVTLEVYDLSGRLVERLIDEIKGPGIHSASWNANGRSAGLYFYRLRAGDFESTRKMVVID